MYNSKFETHFDNVYVLTVIYEKIHNDEGYTIRSICGGHPPWQISLLGQQVAWGQWTHTPPGITCTAQETSDCEYTTGNCSDTRRWLVSGE